MTSKTVQAAARVDTETWTCEAALTVALDAPKILMLKLVEQVAAETVLRATPGVFSSSVCSCNACMHALSAGIDVWLACHHGDAPAQHYNLNRRLITCGQSTQ